MIILVGASASGKTEVAKYLASHFGIKKAITHTSREARDGEKNGVDYFFVPEPIFLQMKSRYSFVETTYYNGHYYGCSKDQVEDDRCVVVDPHGLEAFKALQNKRVVSFLLRADAETRRARMESRGDKPEAIASRLENDESAFSPKNVHEADFIIDTDDRPIEVIAKQIYALYQAELKKLS